MKRYIDDILMVLGLLAFSIAGFTVSLTVGLYSVAASLIAISLIVAKGGKLNNATVKSNKKRSEQSKQ